jgi:putative transposase
VSSRCDRVRPMDNSSRFPFRKPTRLAGFDYANCGMYFITMYTQHKESRFGRIEDSLAQLNEAGAMVSSTWESNVARYPGVALNVFVVMPDQMHAIVFLEQIQTRRNQRQRSVVSYNPSSQVPRLNTRAHVRAGRFPTYNKVFWQRGFHDKILRSNRALDTARTYIEPNPGNWTERRESD